MLLRMLLATAMVVPMFADDRDWRRNDRRNDRRDDRWEERRRRDTYRNNSRYGYGNNTPHGYGYGNRGGGYGQANGIINQTLRDLQVAASRNRVDSHERGHFSRAINELQNMRNGRNSGSLSRVLEDLGDLSRADQVHPRDRQILARDRQALASAYGGYGYNGW